MSEAPADLVIRDILAELGEINMEPVARAAAREAIRQVGSAKIKEIGRRLAVAFISQVELPLGGAIARRKALPAVDRFLDEALAELNR